MRAGLQDWVALTEVHVGFRRIVHRRITQNPAVAQHEVAEFRAAEPRRIGKQRVEHGFELAGRAADDAEDLRGRSLLLQRLGEIVGALPQFAEQTRVLDGDHRLVGEGRDQIDLLVGERFHDGAEQEEDADGGSLPQQRHAQSRAKAA